LPSGSTFPIGTTTNCFTATDQAGNVASCCFDITVNEFANPTHVLACNDLVEVSLDETCTAIVNADMILEGGPYKCYDNYIVELQIGGNWVPAVLGPQHIGQTIVTRVTDPETGNSCWGTISVEDKLPPTIECRDVTIMCGQPLPSEPAPEIVGYQNLLITGLNDLLEVNMYTYNFDFSYLPSTPALDVDCRIQIDDHTFLPDIRINVESPSGFNQNIFTVTGCTGQEWPINCTFDDEGGVITLCADLNGDANLRLQPLQAPGVSTPVLFNFDGMDASGIWKVIISDIAALDDGHIREVGLSILVNLPQVVPTDNCGEVDLTFTDTESGDPCEGLIVTRHWVATDGSGNTAACDQLITVTPLVLDSVDCPPDFIGHCGDSTDPNDTGWPTVNGIQVTSESHLCNIFVGYWDKELIDCGNGLKLVRTWTILDWCTHETIECVQVLKLADDEAPVLDCPNDITVGTDFWYCWASVSVPNPDAVDDCGSAFTLSLTANAGFVVNFGNNYVINQLHWVHTPSCGQQQMSAEIQPHAALQSQ
jgi:subtilisin-like proprotein convertase family protein